MADPYTRQIAPRDASATLPFARPETFGAGLADAVGDVSMGVARESVVRKAEDKQLERDKEATAAALALAKIQESKRNSPSLVTPNISRELATRSRLRDAQQMPPPADPVIQLRFNRIDNQAQQSRPVQPKQAVDFTSPYYANLKPWLELTGYHNVEYRKSKLATHLERCELEQEAVRIANRLSKLQQDESSRLPNSQVPASRKLLLWQHSNLLTSMNRHACKNYHNPRRCAHKVGGDACIEVRLNVVWFKMTG